MRALNKPDISPRVKIFGVCKNFIRKLIYYFFTIIYLGTASFVNEFLLNQLKDNAPLIKKFGPMYIDFDEYPPYSGRIFENFEKNVNENIQCDHGYAYYSGKQKICTKVNEESWLMTKTCFPDAKQIKNAQKPFYANNVHMFKNIEIKVMRILIPHQIMNLTFHHHILMKDL